MLWQIWLQVGPTYAGMRNFLDSVYGVCTDLGTERRIIDLPDILPDFMRSLNVLFRKTLCPKPTCCHTHARWRGGTTSLMELYASGSANLSGSLRGYRF